MMLVGNIVYYQAWIVSFILLKGTIGQWSSSKWLSRLMICSIKNIDTWLINIFLTDVALTEKVLGSEKIA